MGINNNNKTKTLTFFGFMTLVMLFLIGGVFAAAPTLSTLVTGDNNGDGTVDRLVATFDQDFAAASTRDGTGFTVAGNSCAIGSASETGAGIMTFVLTGCTAGATSITPTLSYNDVAGDIYTEGGATPADDLLTFGPSASTDGAGPVLSAANIVVNNNVQPNTVTLTFSEALEPVQAAIAGNYVVTNNGATITYSIASAALSGGNTIVTLTLNAVNPATDTTFITNAAAAAHIKVTPSAANIKDVPLNAYANGLVTEAGATHTLDATAATVVAALVRNSATTYTVSFSEKVDKATAETLNKYPLSGSCAASTGDATGAVLQANGVDVLLTVPDTSGCAQTETVIVTPAASITDVAGVAITSSAATNNIDTLAPTFTASRTALNTIVLTFDENVDVTTTDGSGYAVAGGTVTANTDPAGASNIITLTTTGLTATDGTPAVTYTIAAGTTVDTAKTSNEVANAFSANAADNVKPTFTADRTALNTIVLTFSEAVTGTAIADSFTVVGASSVTNTAVTAGTTVTLTTVGLTATDGTPAVGYVAATGDILDNSAATNEIANGGAINAVDHVAPTFTAARTALNTIVLTFSETVTSTGPDADSFTVGGAASVSAAASAGTTITLTTTGLTATDGTPVVNYVQASGDVQDASAATNNLANGGAVNAADNVKPTFTADRTALNTIVLTFSEAVTGTAIADSFTVVGASSVTNTAVTAGTTVTLTTVGLTATDGTPAVGYVAATGDILDNSAATNEIANGGAVNAVDHVAPTFTADRTALNTIVLTFSEAVTGTAIADSFTVVGASSVTNTAVTAGTTVTLTTVGLTATDGTPAVGYVAATGDILDNSAATNEIANGGAINAVDHVAPTFTADRTALNTIVLTFSEAVTSTGPDADSFTVGGAASVSAAASAGTTITLTTTGLTATNGTPVVNYVQVSGDVQDASAATNNLANGGAVNAADNVAPTVSSISLNDTSLILGETSLLTIVFSEPVISFTNADLTTIENGGLSAVSSADNITWTATFTPSASVQDVTNVITLTNTGLTDVLGNAGVGTNSTANYAIDNVVPVVSSISLNDSTLVVGETATLTIVFSEPVISFTNADLTTIENGGLSAVSSADNITWTATFTPTVSLEDASNLITITNTGLTDYLGNAGVGTNSTANYVIDTLRPSYVSMVLNDTTVTVGETANLTVVFSEPVIAFTTADFTTVQNGALSALSSSDNVTWTALFTPTVSVEQDLTNIITLDSTGLTDYLGNAGLGTNNSANYNVDTLRPTVSSISLDDTSLTIGQTATLTIVFSEPVISFDNSDITTINNGNLTTLTTANNITWTATFTPTASIEDLTNVITITNTGLTDYLGNAGTGTNSTANYQIDGIAPTVSSISLNDSTLVAGETANVTIVFSEPVIAFNNADLTIVNGGLSAVSSANNITWTALFTPTVSLEDASNVITITNTGLTDYLGNAGVGTNDTANFVIDTLRPTVTTISLNDTTLLIGETANLTIVFSEPVIAFTNADITTIANGGLSPVSSSDNVTWNAIFTPTGSVQEDLTNVITLNTTTLTDVLGNAGSATNSTANYYVDTLAPTVSINVSDIAFKIGDTSLVTFNFSEDVLGFSNADLIIANGNLTAVSTADNITWTATFTPNTIEDATNVITVNKTGLTDTLGNAGVGTTDSNNYAIDTIAPIITINGLSTTDTTPTLTGTIDDTTTNISINVNGQTPTVTNNLDGTWTATLTTPLAIDVYEVYLNATDAAGNLAQDVTSDELNVADVTYAFFRQLTQNPRYGTLISNYELSNVTGWNSWTLGNLLNSSQGVLGQKLTTSDVNTMYVYNGSSWTTYATYTWDFNSHDSAFIGYYVFDLKTSAIGKYIRHN